MKPKWRPSGSRPWKDTSRRCEESSPRLKPLAEQQRQDVATATKRADHLVAELFEATSELLEMSKREQGASNGRSEGLKSPEVREYSVQMGVAGHAKDCGGSCGVDRANRACVRPEGRD